MECSTEKKIIHSSRICVELSIVWIRYEFHAHWGAFHLAKRPYSIVYAAFVCRVHFAVTISSTSNTSSEHFCNANAHPRYDARNETKQQDEQQQQKLLHEKPERSW